MKKIFTLLSIAMASCLGVSAQNLEFRLNGTAVADGATVTIEAEEDEMTGDIVCNTNPSTATDRLVLASVDGSDLTGEAYIEIQENTLEAEIIGWCMGGNCVPVTSDEFTKRFGDSASSPAAPIIKLQYDAEPTQYGEMLTKMEAKVGAETRTIYIKFVYKDPAGISGTTSGTTEVARYNLSGQQLTQAQPGVNIVKLSSGRIVKVVEK